MPLPIGSVMPSIIKLDLAWLIILVDDLTIYPDLFVVLTLDMPPDVIEGRQRGRDTMCGRFASKLSAEFIRQLFKAEGSPNLPPSWNLAPSQERAGGAAASRDRHPPPGRAALGTAAAFHQRSEGRSQADQRPS